MADVEGTIKSFVYALERPNWKSLDEKKIFIRGAITMLNSLHVTSNDDNLLEISKRLDEMVRAVDMTEPSEFRVKARMVGLPEDCFNKTFQLRRRSFTIKDIDVGRKNCVVLQERKGKTFYGSVPTVLAFLK